MEEEASELSQMKNNMFPWRTKIGRELWAERAVRQRQAGG